MRLTVLTGCVLLLAVARAQEPRTPAEKFKALVKAQEKAQKAFSDAYQAAKTGAEREKASTELGPQSRPQSHAKAFLALMKEHPRDPAALDALGWLLTLAAYTPEAGQAVDLALRDWIGDARLKRVCEPVYHYNPTLVRLLRGAIEKSPHREVQGNAHFSLARSLRARLDDMGDRTAAEREPLEKEADQLLQKVIDRYADLKHLTTLGEEAERLRFELRNLGVGKTAPELEGEDLDGKKLKLSDFRGKVTLVVFWAGTCGACLDEVPHERELLKRYAGKPFAIVGVNSDVDRKTGKAVAEKAGIPWRSFADGDPGPIVKRWNVDSWPQLYLLDGTGTIRSKGDYLRGGLDELVEELMKEAGVRP